jgi:glycopeptide antibiotics resistance protein
VFFVNDKPRPSAFGFADILSFGAFQHRYNLIPFLVFKETYQAVFVDHCFSYFIINFLGNIMIFIPIGFFIPLLWHKMRSLGKTVLCGFIISLFIELIQFPLYRGTDIDDLWLNTLGVLVGYFVFILVKKIIPRSLAQPCANLLMDHSK